MKKLFLKLNIFFYTISFSGCEMIGDIFQTGFWFGVIIIIAILLVMGFILRIFTKT